MFWWVNLHTFFILTQHQWRERALKLILGVDLVLMWPALSKGGGYGCTNYAWQILDIWGPGKPSCYHNWGNCWHLYPGSSSGRWERNPFQEQSLPSLLHSQICRLQLLRCFLGTERLPFLRWHHLPFWEASDYLWINFFFFLYKWLTWDINWLTLSRTKTRYSTASTQIPTLRDILWAVLSQDHRIKL